ncbi:MAG: peroxidase family protein [Microthrixaceae bacterium]
MKFTPASVNSPPPRRVIVALSLPVVLAGMGLTSCASVDTEAAATEASPTAQQLADYRSLDGSDNNPDDPTLGAAGEVYPRSADANYADDLGEPVDGPDTRYVSNRIFNDGNQNIFSENEVTHWGFVWGQFVDHTIGLRESSEDDMTIAFDPEDPLEEFTNDLGGIAATRSEAADGTGEESPREQVNTVSSFLDGWSIYGGSDERLDWLREGTVDGDPSNNAATLLSDDGYLPTAADRPDEEVPEIDLMGRLRGDPTPAVVAGDIRANENIALTAAHTLFLREHNRIVEELPDTLDDETKFEIARRVVVAELQYVTFEEFLPSMGVELDDYEGYDSSVDPSITNEFATVGYRAHSQIHGEFEAEIAREDLTDEDLAALEAAGVETTVVADAGEEVVEVAIPLNVAFGNPELLERVGLGNLLAGLASESAYANDEQIDNQLRSVLFQVPGPDTENPADCLDGSEIANCFSGVNDLGSLDVARAYDHGMPSYNDLRESVGLPRVDSFTELTGEDTEEFPDDPEIDAENPIDDPSILDFVHLEDIDGNELEPGTDEADGETVVAERRTTTAARLKAIFGDVGEVDAFTGMVSEPHVAGAEFGELQLTMWQDQFQALRDGDRFYYGNDPVLDDIADTYGIDYRTSLRDLIVTNSDAEEADLPENVFKLADAQADAGVEEAADTAADTDTEADAGVERAADTAADADTQADANETGDETGDETVDDPGDRTRRAGRRDRDRAEGARPPRRRNG